MGRMTTRRKPTEGELEILTVLWDRGPSTVRDVAAVLGRDQAYTTILKLLQIMTEKGLVERDESARSHVYVACQTRDCVQQNVLSKVITRLFDGSTRRLVLGALSGQPTDLADLQALKLQVDAMLREHVPGDPEGEA